MSLVLPCISTLGLALALPYLLAHGLAPLLVTSRPALVLIQRRIYPALLLSTALLVFFTVQARQFKKLVEHIKNDRYLVGRRLVNYNHQVSVGGGLMFKEKSNAIRPSLQLVKTS